MLKSIIGLVILTAFANAQTPQPRKDYDPILLIEASKKTYKSGEPFHVSIKLINKGSRPLLIHKDGKGDWLYPAGLEIYVKAIKRFGAAVGCEIGGIYAPQEDLLDRRSPETKLKEDFVVLKPDGFIGFENHLSGDCLGMNGGGIFELMGIYRPYTETYSELTNLPDLPGEFIKDGVRCKPIRITVLKPTSKNP